MYIYRLSQIIGALTFLTARKDQCQIEHKIRNKKITGLRADRVLYNKFFSYGHVCRRHESK